MDRKRIKDVVGNFLNSQNFQKMITPEPSSELSAHSLFDLFANAYQENLDEIKLHILDFIQSKNSTLEMMNIFDCFLRKRSSQYYKRSADEWSEVQKLIEDRLVELVSRIRADKPDPDFITLLERGDDFVRRFISEETPKAFARKVLEINTYLARQTATTA